ncbi:hypothetical protein NHX12_005728 [Muraenolepis orangiensis]|uniref:MTSS1-like protein n=1 Tax=Muraenolepis orangiensis TaxID=630683 RepID=A0A9Q0DS27_9TELE|nr:hypothetical protein NHX12_005728 [Muraenolepis orangiensis]
MCMRHRSIEAKLRQFTNALMESLICPLQDRIEDWKKTANQLDKDHAKEYKRSRRGDLQPQVDSAMQDVTDMCLLMEEMEKQAVRRALVEERGRFCTFIGFLQPVVNGEIAMLGEITHLQAIIDDLTVLTTDPHKLPPVIKDLKGSDYSWSYQTPPSSPSSSGSRKSSISVSSHDSGFVSQDANVYSKPPSPMPSDITSQKSSSSASSEASETCQSVSECSSPTTDWSKAGQYEQPVTGPAVQRRKEPLDRLREQESSPGNQGYSPGPHLDPDGQRTRMHPATIAAKHGEEVSPAASDLAMVLTRGLSMEQQKSSRDSLQYSSGYSTQTNTPSCSEDTIPSQDYDCYSVNGDNEAQEGQSDFDKSSTIPRHSNIAQNYRRMIQTKRPASTAGLPSGAMGSCTPGTATIRRTPSTKPGVRRTLSSAGPIPIRPPIVPVKTPTVPGDPHLAGAGAGGSAGGAGGVPVRVGSEECVFFAGAEEAHGALDYVKASPKRLSLPNTAWGSGAGLEVYMHHQQQQHRAAASGGGGGGGGGGVTEEEQMIAANRHSLVEKIGELVASAQALGEGQFPFPSLPDDPDSPGGGNVAGGQASGAEGQAGGEGEVEGAGGDMLTTIRRGVRLRKTVSNDRSAPRIL